MVVVVLLYTVCSAGGPGAVQILDMMRGESGGLTIQTAGSPHPDVCELTMAAVCWFEVFEIVLGWEEGGGRAGIHPRHTGCSRES